MPYLGHPPHSGEDNNFKILDTISSYTFTFDGSDSGVVSTSNETIYSVDHRFITGQRVKYTNGGGGDINGLTNNSYYFIIKQDKNNIQLATSAANAISGTAINITAVGSGTSHTLNVAFDGVNTKFKATHTSGQKARITRASQLVLSVNGVIQQPHDSTSPSTGFGIDSSNIVFSQAPASTDAFWGHILTNNNVTFDISDNKVDHFSGDGSTVAFTLSKSPSNNENVLVTIDGVVQYPNDGAGNIRAYSVNVNVISFTTAPGSGTQIEVRHIGFAGATTGDTVTGFYGRTGNASLKNTDNITVNDAAITGNATVTGNTTITGDLTVNGTTTTLDTKLTEVDQLLVAANNSTVAVAVTQSGAGDILSLYDNTTEVFKVADGGNITATGSLNLGNTLYWDGDNTATIDNAGISSTFRFKTGGTTVMDITATKNVHIKDDRQLLIGASNDLTIYHSSSANKSYVTSATHDVIHSFNVGKPWTLQTTAAEKRIYCPTTKSVELYWNGTKKFETSGSGTITTGISTVTGDLSIADKIVHTGDTNTAIRFSDADTISFETAGSPRAFINSAGDLTIGGSAGNLGKVYIKQAADTDTEGFTLLNAGGSNSFRLFLGDSSGAVAHIGHGGQKQFNITQAGNVGVGITNPAKDFEVYRNGLVNAKIKGNVAGGLGAELILQNANAAANGYSEIQFQDAGTNVFSKIRGFNLTDGSNNGYMALYTASATQGLKERVRITDAGDVGIGTDNATRGPLHIHQNSTGDCQIHLTNRETGVTSSDGFTIFAGGDAGPDCGFVNRETGGAFEFYTHNGTSVGERLRITNTGIVEANTSVSSTYAATTNITPHIRVRNKAGADNIYGGIQLRADRSNGAAAIVNIACVNNSSDYQSSLVIQTRDGGGSGPFSEKLRIDSAGRVIINQCARTANAKAFMIKGDNDTSSTASTDASGSNSYKNSAIVIEKGISNVNLVAGLIDAWDGNIHGVGLGWGYDGSGYHFSIGTNDNTSDRPVERMRFDRRGNIGINIPSPTNITNHVGLTLRGHGSTAAGFINFMDSADNSDGRILAEDGKLIITADPSDNTAGSEINFRVDNTTNRLTIASNGHLQFGGVLTSNLGTNSTSANNITPANNHWITFASVPYGHGAMGEVYINWKSVQAPSCCYHGDAHLRIGGNHFTYHYGWESTLELISCQAHNSAWFRSWRLIRDGSALKLQGKWAGSTVGSGTFYVNITRGTLNPQTTAYISAITPVVENSLSGTVQAELDAQRDADSPPDGGGDFIQHGKYGIFHTHKGLSTKGTFWNYKQEQAAVAGTNYTQTAGSYSKIIPNNELFDVGGDYASVSSGRYTCPYDGTYLFSWWGLLYPHNHSTSNITMSVRLNGNGYGNGAQMGGVNSGHALSSGTQLVRAAQGDNLELWLYTVSGSATKAYSSQWNMSVYFMG